MVNKTPVFIIKKITKLLMSKEFYNKILTKNDYTGFLIWTSLHFFELIIELLR